MPGGESPLLLQGGGKPRGLPYSARAMASWKSLVSVKIS